MIVLRFLTTPPPRPRHRPGYIFIIRLQQAADVSVELGPHVRPAYKSSDWNPSVPLATGPAVPGWERIRLRYLKW